MNDASFFYYWITFSILVLTASCLAFFWLYRKGYFRNQDRARYLALWAEVPGIKSKDTSTTETERRSGNSGGESC